MNSNRLDKEEKSLNSIRVASLSSGYIPPPIKHLDWKAAEETLFDRKVQLDALLAAYKRSHQRAELVLITGASGTGKTALANMLFPHVKADGGAMFRAKFDINQFATTHSPCFRAFRTFARYVIAKGEDEAQKMRQAIEHEFGEAEIELLLEMIPELTELLMPEDWQEIVQKQQTSGSGLDYSSHSNSDSGIDLSDSPSKVASVYKRFLRCVSSPGSVCFVRPLCTGILQLQLTVNDNILIYRATTCFVSG